MTKSLLTSTDIKLFILESLREMQKEEVLLTRKNLSKILGISTSTIDNYKFQGMPYILKYGKIRFSLTKALRWLEKNNKNYNTEKLYEFEQKE